jgi:hypothetical protein
VMFVILGVLAAVRWDEYVIAARMFCLAFGQVGGWAYALRWHRRGRA